MDGCIKLRDVARLCDHTHFDIAKDTLGSRRGPFPFYGDLFERFEVDDFGVEAPGVIFMAAAGRVLNNEGGFRLALEHGRCGSNAFAHVVVPFDPADADYIAACLAFHPHAVDYIGGANQLQTLDELAVLRIALPWPAPETRTGFVAALVQAQSEVDEARQALRAAREANLPQEELCRLEREADCSANRRDILVNDFMEFGVLRGHDCSATVPADHSGLAHYSDARAEWMRGQLAQQAADEAAQQGGVVVPEALAAALGPLAPIVRRDTAGLTVQDVAWELGPLAVLRACAGQTSWDRIAGSLELGQGSLVEAIDSALAEVAGSNLNLSFMSNLSYSTSTLDGERLKRWCRELGGVEPGEIRPETVRAVFDLAAGGPALPAEVSRLMGACVAACAQASGGHAVYLPELLTDGLADAVWSALPEADAFAQCVDNEALLEACLVRGVAVRHENGRGGFLVRSAGCEALLSDGFAGRPADVVVLEVPDPWKAWSPKPPSHDDPRWAFGAPTRMRPTFAWAEHCLAHLRPGGTALMLLATSQIQTRKPVDSGILARLVGQGCVATVVALPARIWGDDRPPMSLVALRCPDPGRACLMVDATCLDDFEDSSVLSPNPQRRLRPESLEGLCRLLDAWLARGELAQVGDVPHAVVGAPSLLQGGASLAPWQWISVK